MRILVIIGLLFTLEGAAQESISITYKEKRIMTDFYKKNLDNYPKVIKNKLIEEFNGVQKQLVINNNKSIYSSFEETKEYTEKLPDEVDGDITTKKTRKSTKAATNYYKDIANNQLLIEKSVRVEKILIKENLNATQWQLTDNTKKINNLECKQAISKDTKGRAITAWYSEDIAINNGPAEYGGLPGLIVYLETASWIYEMQELKKIQAATEIVIPSSKDAITMEEFKERFNSKGGIKTTTSTIKRRKMQ
jgi:GLPGLI family protein